MNAMDSIALVWGGEDLYHIRQAGLSPGTHGILSCHRCLCFLPSLSEVDFSQNKSCSFPVKLPYSCLMQEV